jgi:DNA-binding transcriptional MerR regulator
VVEPARTSSAYRLYDEAAVERLRTMRLLVEDGWTASVAARAETTTGRRSHWGVEPQPAHRAR